MSEEIDKACGQVIVETARDTRTVLSRLFGPAINEIGLGLGEKAREWRLRNLLSINDRIQKICFERGYSPEQLKVLPFGDSIRAIESASSEEEERIQDLWARLIANAISPESKIEVKKIYVDLLQSLSSSEALLLEILWFAEGRLQFRNKLEVDAFIEDFEKVATKGWRKISMEDRKITIQNLIRLRCITFRPRQIDIGKVFKRTFHREMQRESIDVDPSGFQKIFQELAHLIFVTAGIEEPKSTGTIPLFGHGGFVVTRIDTPELNYMLTPLGKDLMQACNLSHEQPTKMEDPK